MYRRKTLTGSPDPTHANGTDKPCKQKYTLNSFAIELLAGQTDSFSIFVDFTLETNTEFVFDYERDGIQFTITAPTGQVFTEESEEVINDPDIASSRLTFMDASGVSRSLPSLCLEKFKTGTI